MLLVGISEIRNCCDGSLVIELLACAIHLVQLVPLSKGRYCLDLQPLTHVVIHHILMKVLMDTAQFSNASRYWRLASLALRWLRLVLRGPLPVGASAALNIALIKRFYADAEPVADEVALRSSLGNATAYVFRCLLSVDSPALARVMYLALLRGCGIDGLLDSHHGNVQRPFMEQTVHVGLDILRLLFQRDVLFCRLYGQHAADRAAGLGAVDIDAGGLLLAHHALFAEFGFNYPAAAQDSSGSPSIFNPFSAKRLWQSIGSVRSTVGLGGKRPNPSYLAILLEFVGARSNPGICRLALYAFTQSAFREPALVLRTLQLEAWRLQSLCADLCSHITEPPEDTSAMEAAVARPHGKWDSIAESQFMFEVTEMDLPSDTSFHLNASSFQTGLPVCSAVDLVYQLADDAVVQAADLVSWASCLGGVAMCGSALPGGAASDTWLFQMAYLRGIDLPTGWLDADATADLTAGLSPPPPVIATASSRSLVLRSLALLVGGSGPKGAANAAQRLAQVLLGLDPDGTATRSVDVDLARVGQPSLLDAVMELLEHPPQTPPTQADNSLLGSNCKPIRSQYRDFGLPHAVEQHTMYEAALGIVVSLLIAPASRDVALRYVCYAWPSRYEVLRGLFTSPWSAMKLPLRRVLLAEVAMLLQVAYWEMRIIQPMGSPQAFDADNLNIVNQQRFEMKRVVSGHIQEVVHTLTRFGETGPVPPGGPPFLVVVALKLYQACESLASSCCDTPIVGKHDINALLQASCSNCLMPSPEGRFNLSLQLYDPNIVLHLVRIGKQVPSSSWNSPMADSPLATSGDDTIGAELDGSNISEYLVAANSSACSSFFTKTITRAFGLFMSATLYHLVDSTRACNSVNDPRSQCVRAHLEGLLPTLMADAAATQCTPLRLEFLVGLGKTLILAIQHAEGPVPLAFLHSLFALLRKLALHPYGSHKLRCHAHEILLLLLQRMTGLGSRAETMVTSNLAELHELVFSLLEVASVAADIPACQDGGIQVALPLLSTLLLRVPLENLDALCGSPRFWQKMLGLLTITSTLRASIGQSTAIKFSNCRLSRLNVTLIAALICRHPQLALSFFEFGCLAAVLQPDFIQVASCHPPPLELNNLDNIDLIAVLSVLQVLVVVARTLPAHHLSLLGIVAWVERHQRLLSDLIQWVIRVPLVNAMETAGVDLDMEKKGIRRALTIPQSLNMSSKSSGQMLLCMGTSRHLVNASHIGFIATYLSSKAQIFGNCNADVSCGSERIKPDWQPEASDARIEVCYRCASSLVELWALLQNKSCGGSLGVVACRIKQLEPMFTAVSHHLLAHIASPTPLHNHVSSDGAVAPSIDEQEAAVLAGCALPHNFSQTSGVCIRLYPAEATRLATYLHVLHAWRHDSISQKLSMCSSVASLAQPNLVTTSTGNRFEEAMLGGISTASVAGPPGLVAQHFISQVRSRACVLSVAFSHACSRLLTIRADSVQKVRDGHQVGTDPQLIYLGSDVEYCLLHSICELSLYLLGTHLVALRWISDHSPSSLSASGAAAAASPSPGSGAPRLALTMQCLRALRQLSAATHGRIVPVSNSASCDSESQQVLDLTWLACLSEKIEDQLNELQSLW